METDTNAFVPKSISRRANPKTSTLKERRKIKTPRPSPIPIRPRKVKPDSSTSTPVSNETQILRADEVFNDAFKQTLDTATATGLPPVVIRDMLYTIVDQEARYSNFHIILVNNHNPKTDKEKRKQIKRLRAFVNQVFSTAKMGKIIKFNEAGEWSNRYIAAVRVNFAIEYGENKYSGKVHAHVHLGIKHYSNILVDVDKLRTKMKSKLNLPSVPWVRVKAKDSNENLLNYIAKNPV